MSELNLEDLHRAAEMIDRADVIVILSGAGMGVDSGLPDFRGSEGFWRAYPMLRRIGSFEDMASQRTFINNPSLAWGFYGHRFNLYRETVPHQGFQILKDWFESKDDGFVFTSNVDGHFQKSGFDPSQIYEIHGSINHVQCASPECDVYPEIWRMEDKAVDVGEDLHTVNPIRCRCGHVARPNIQMFWDGVFCGDGIEEQADRYRPFVDMLKTKRAVLIEIGAGDSIPSVMRETEYLSQWADGIIEINPGRELRNTKDNWVGFPVGALEALTAINSHLKVKGQMI